MLRSRRVPCFLMLAMAFPVGAQTCKPAIPPSTPTDAFTFHDNGTVTHNATGLMWKRCLEGQVFDDNGTAGNFSDDLCTDNPMQFNWEAALNRPGVVNAGDGYAGYTDWWLPNSKELGSIVEVQCNGPAINLTVFPDTPSSDMWTSSPYLDNSSYARFVRFSYGQDGANPRTGTDPIRLVRRGP